MALDAGNGKILDEVGASSWPTYPEYKDSGVEWLGEIPAHWELKRLKYVVTCNDEVLSEKTPPDYRIQYVEISSVSHDKGIETSEEYDFDQAPSRARRKVRHGDTILSTVRTYLKAVAPIIDPPENLVVSTGFAVIRPSKENDGRFFSYLLQSEGFVGEVVSKSVGVSYPAINPSEILCFFGCLPTSSEQAAIAAFLDRETARLDSLIAKKQRLIELLQEKRTALISQAVTKGLDPEVPMKDSGVEWLGEIPGHWEVKKLKYSLTLQRGHDLPSDNRQEGTVPIVSSAGVSGSHDTVAAKAPGIVTGRYGTIGKFHIVEEDYWPLNTTLYSTNCYGNNIRYLWYMLQNISDVFLVNSTKSAVPGVDRNDLHPTLIALPPTVAEQEAISSYLDQATEKLDKLCGKVIEGVEKLKEYRTALISAAVTGKIDTRKFSKTVPSPLAGEG